VPARSLPSLKEQFGDKESCLILHIKISSEYEIILLIQQTKNALGNLYQQVPLIGRDMKKAFHKERLFINYQYQ
jgi:hypothetical protein